MWAQDMHEADPEFRAVVKRLAPPVKVKLVPEEEVS
jgi:hypothetical protein